MEGLCRASSSLSIADSPLLINAKWSKTKGILRFLSAAGPRVLRPKYLSGAGLALF